MTQRRQTALVLAALAVVLVALSTGLRPDAFYVGDPGVKLLAAQHAADHPADPFRIPLPAIGPDRVPHVSPFFTVHDDHAHAVTSELFPLLTAPMLAGFGLRGLYVLPGLGFLGALAACAWLGRALDPRRAAPLILVTGALGTPLLFYGLEFWEHAPAVAAATAGAALLADAGRHARPRPWRDALAGALFGCAILLRPEAAWFAAAVAAASRWLPRPPRAATLAIAGSAALLTLAPLTAVSLVHFGTIVPSHVSSNAALLQDGWASSRAAQALQWFTPAALASGPRTGAADAWQAGPVAIAALLSAAWGGRHEGRRFLWLVSGLYTALVVLTAPNDGGGQWGPRYLLFAYAPLTVLGSDLVGSLIEARRPLRQPRGARLGSLVVPALALLAVAGLWTQRAAYRELRGTKLTYGRIADFVDREAPPGGTVITDIWWLDQIAAAPLRDRHLLFAGTVDDAKGILQRMSGQRVAAATLVLTRDAGPAADEWTAGTCYRQRTRRELDVRSLVAVQVQLDCGGTAPQEPGARPVVYSGFRGTPKE